jgi:hypothetical protein
VSRTFNIGASNNIQTAKSLAEADYE